jgi:anaerobic ribonucleoside-triphosphate reductase activating protein
MLKFFNHEIVFQEIPDQVTLAINITNCPNHCEDCHSSYLASDFGEPLTRDSLSLLIDFETGISCVCFMGGDSDKKQIEELASYVKDKYPDIQVGWYSGQYELPENVQYFDYIKLGPYMKNRGPLTDRNTNQRMYHVIRNQSDLILKDITNVFWRN